MSTPYKPRHNKKAKIAPTITHEHFKAYREDGSLQPDIIKAFIIKQPVTAMDAVEGKIQIEEYLLQLVMHPDVRDGLKKEHAVQCIISVQFREHGHYAIALPYHRKLPEQCNYDPMTGEEA